MRLTLAAYQVVWNSKMREEVLELMEAARQNPESAGTPQDFRFKALQVRGPVTHCLQHLLLLTL